MESGTFIVSNISDGDGPVYPPPLPLPDPLPPFEPVSSLEVNTFSSSKPKIVFFSFFAKPFPVSAAINWPTLFSARAIISINADT